MQVVLDPAAVHAVGEVSVAALPPAARAFGFVPDVSQCLPGDIVLSRTASGEQNVVARAQQAAGLAPEHAAWTHVSVVLYDEMIVEAVPWRGVRQRSLYVDVPSRVLRVRRCMNIDETSRLKLALRALSMLGSRYSHWGILDFGMHLVRGLWNRDAFAGDRHIIVCSEVFHDAFLHVTRGMLAGCPVEAPVTPAHLSFTPDLEDVHVGWLKLV